MRHLTDEELSAYLDGAFKGRDAEEAGRHLATCQPCREALAELTDQDESLKPALAHDPGEAYFERFAARVEARIGDAGASRARPRGEGLDLGRFFRSPRALAWSGGVAVVVVAGGLALMTSREVLPPDLRDRDLAQRVERAAPGETKQAPAGETTPTVRLAEPAGPLPPADDAGQAAPPADAGPATPEVSAVEAPILAGEREGVAAPGSRDQRQASGAPPAREPVARPVGANRPLARPPGDAKALADALAPMPSVTSPPTSTLSPARPASPGRSIEVRRNEAGEEVPVRREGQRRAAPPPPPTTAGGADQAAAVRKKLAAEPLDAEEQSAPSRTPGATGAPSAKSESVARDYSFAPSPPGTVTPTEAQRAVPGPGAVADARLCGEVRDPADRPIAGAQVVLTDLGRTTTTDAAGRFCMSVPRGEHPLSVMAVGYVVSRRSVSAEGAEAGVRVTLAAVSVLERKALSVAERATPGRGREALPTDPLGPPPIEPPAEPPADRRDDYSALADTLRRLVREAQRIEADAAARRSAARYDLAAGAWERALGRLMDGPLGIETRRHLAETRYHAWEIDPNARRARAAVEALTAYLARAPAGPERDRAGRWLDQVRP